MDKENESIQQENPSTEEVKESEPVTPAPESNPSNDKLTVWSWVRFFVKVGIVIAIIVFACRACTANSNKERIIDALEHLQISQSSDLILYWAIDENLEAADWDFQKTDEEDVYNVTLTGYAPNYDADVELMFEVHILDEENFQWRIPLCKLDGEISTEQTDINYVIAIIYDNVGESVVNSLTEYLLGL